MSEISFHLTLAKSASKNVIAVTFESRTPLAVIHSDSN